MLNTPWRKSKCYRSVGVVWEVNRSLLVQDLNYWILTEEWKASSSNKYPSLHLPDTKQRSNRAVRCLSSLTVERCELILFLDETMKIFAQETYVSYCRAVT